MIMVLPLSAPATQATNRRPIKIEGVQAPLLRAPARLLSDVYKTKDPAHGAARTFEATLVRSIFDNKNAKEVLAQHGHVISQLQERFPQAAALLDQVGPDVLASPFIRWGTGGRFDHTIPGYGQTGRSGAEPM